MGNMGSSGAQGRRRHSIGGAHPPPPPPQPEMTRNRYVLAAATPYPPPPYPNPGPNPPPYYHHYPGYYPPPAHAALPMPPQAPYDHHHGGWVTGRYPYGPMMQHAPPPPLPPPPLPPPNVEHQKAVTIRNDVNLKKETLRIEPDEGYPGRYLVSFIFDATIAGSITLMFFAKEGKDCHLTPMSESVHPPFTVHFDQGLVQRFRQPPGTGIDLSVFDEMELSKDKEMDIYPLAIKAEASPDSESGKLGTSSMNSQITQAVFERDKGEYHVRVVKQILWVNGKRYELQEIYGIGNSVEGEEYEGNDPGKECVICLSEPRDTTVLPCRHMCMCSECAKVLSLQTNRCPICRQPVERLLEIKVNNGNDE